MFRCIGNAPSTGQCDRDMKGCSCGSSCLLGPYGPGICCDKQVEDQWLTEMNPVCEEDSYYPWDKESWENTEKLIGRKCCHEYV
ncbi:hypothetical protein OESDEN_20785 [Oesophagostomum dentatum]|uniref:Uncharacterized protein n=1 Tax=Oesophagostomum dentatum TaxID=61180 RepID=A0A0B1S2I0_OESDE|nr:hypothetical protein OESDEN_20785 [Oesophagostomum dentatum]